MHTRGKITAKATDTATGLMTVTAVKDVELPRFEITCTMMRPATSSIMAALAKTTPNRLCVRPHVVSMLNVVPSDVEHNAAPAAKA